MKVINSEYSELMFDIAPEQTIERTNIAIIKSKFPSKGSTEFRTSDFILQKTNYSFYIWLPPTEIKNSDILTTEMLSKDEIKVKISFSNKCIRSDLYSVIEREKLEEQTLSIVFKYDEGSDEYHPLIELDDTDKRNMVKTHAILETARKQEFKTVSEIDFIKTIINKSKTNKPIIINESDFSRSKKLNTLESTSKKLCFLLREELLSEFLREIYDTSSPPKFIRRKTIYKLTNNAMDLINSEEDGVEFDLSKYGRYSIQ